MPPKVALLVCIAFVVWLFLRARKRGQKLSPGLWIPFIWILIIGSKPLSLWFGAGGATDSPDDYLEGSPLDRLVFLILIAAGMVVLARRQVVWTQIWSRNKWLLLFVLYCGISIIWSDYPFVSFKRWVKDTGNIVMVLIVLTETDPVAAFRSLFSKCIYLLIPLSILLVKYFPDLGRYYDRWTYLPSISGVTTGKNLLGMTLFVSAVLLAWLLVTVRDEAFNSKRSADQLPLIILSTMTLWLLYKCGSSTASACTVVAVIIVLAMRLSSIRKKLRGVIGYSFLFIAGFYFFNAVFNIGDVFFQLMNRDTTFTGRTDIWSAVLKEKVNPLFGTGFYSFWLGDRIARLSERYSFPLNEAHNAYLETYLNSGLIGLCLLIGLLMSSAKRISREVLTGASYATLRFAFLVAIAFYAMTESVFNRLSPIWIIFLIIVTEGPRSHDKRPGIAVSSTSEKASGKLTRELVCYY